MIDINQLTTNKLKLVIWDLDDTFWKGTLSEGPVVPIESNIQLVKDLTDRGVINAICSKNDEEEALNTLHQMDGIDAFFVFNSIDWTPKGQRIAHLISTMGLRPVNCLFLDDNVVNLNEAAFYSAGLMLGDPGDIEKLCAFVRETPVSDLDHRRLEQYRVLESKQKAREMSSDNMSFLMSSNTRVEIHTDCLSHLDRIAELVGRTNQLNYTKLRSTREELEALISRPDVQSGYVTVSDAFGDYGIVGFYAVQEVRLIHFLFSCRTIGQGVEQWVYAQLGYPELSVVGEVVNPVTKDPAPSWINQPDASCETSGGDIGHITSYSAKVVFKGACDLSIMASFLKSDQIVEEFTYIGERGNRIEHHNHSVNYLSFPFLHEEDKLRLLADCPFNDVGMFQTRMYDADVSLVFLSTQIEPMLGIYEHKETGQRFAFGEYVYPLDNPQYWQGYVDKTLPVYQNDFSLEWLKCFAEKYRFVGRMSPQEYICQLEKLLSMIASSAKVCLLLGSEIPYEANKQEGYKDRHLYYKEINDLLKDYARKNERVKLINFTDYIKGQSDFTNNINHYKRHIYYEAAQKANEVIKEAVGNTAAIPSPLHAKMLFLLEAAKYRTKQFLRFIGLSCLIPQ